MRRNQYSSEKRRKELDRKKKQEEKRQRKLDRRNNPSDPAGLDATSVPGTGESADPTAAPAAEDSQPAGDADSTPAAPEE